MHWKHEHTIPLTKRQMLFNGSPLLHMAYILSVYSKKRREQACDPAFRENKRRSRMLHRALQQPIGDRGRERWPASQAAAHARRRTRPPLFSRAAARAFSHYRVRRAVLSAGQTCTDDKRRPPATGSSQCIGNTQGAPEIDTAQF